MPESDLHYCRGILRSCRYVTLQKLADQSVGERLSIIPASIPIVKQRVERHSVVCLFCVLENEPRSRLTRSGSTRTMDQSNAMDKRMAKRRVGRCRSRSCRNGSCWIVVVVVISDGTCFPLPHADPADKLLKRVIRGVISNKGVYY